MMEPQADPVLFDFSSYLADKNQGVKYEVERLSGGIMNVVVRATRITNGRIRQEEEENWDRGSRIGWTWEKEKSLILKYAPPFIAAVGDEKKVGVYRQVCSGCMDASSSISVFKCPFGQ